VVASLNLAVIHVANLDRSAAFFEALCVTFSRERHGNGPEHLSACLNGLVFELYPRRNEAAKDNTRLGFKVPSLSEALNAIQSVGGVVASPPSQSEFGLRAVVIDPDGRRVELSQS